MAIGYTALQKNTGSRNIAIGSGTMSETTQGLHNTAIGGTALSGNTTGDDNTAVGLEALDVNTTGNFNTALGSGANVSATNQTNSTAIGANTIIASSNAMAFGSQFVLKWVFGISNTTGVSRALEVGSAVTNGNGAYLTTGGTWTNASSRDKKKVLLS